MSENKNFVNNVETGNCCITFAPTVPVLHTIRTACGSFSQVVHITKDNTPPMPLFDAHLGGFFI